METFGKNSICGGKNQKKSQHGVGGEGMKGFIGSGDWMDHGREEDGAGASQL